MDKVGNPHRSTSDKSQRVTTGNDSEISTYLEIAEQKTGRQSLTDAIAELDWTTLSKQF
jgi:hypothetical protein